MAHPALALVIAALLALAGTDPALAHHMEGGTLPATFASGLLSGLGHPVIGLDHLAFIVAAGLLVGAAGLPLWLPLVFVAASLGGVAVHLALLGLPAVELVIASSVCLAGVLLATGRRMPGGAWAAIFAVAGLFHGYAYGEAIVGSEPTPLGAYLVGLALVQAAIATAAALVAWRRAWEVASLAPRLAGGVVLGVGLSALAGQILPG